MHQSIPTEGGSSPIPIQDLDPIWPHRKLPHHFSHHSPHPLSQGALFLNDRQCKIVQRQLEFDGGIAYGIDCLLTDPSLGGRCDSFFTVEFMVSPAFLIILPHTKATAHRLNTVLRRTRGNAHSCFDTTKVKSHHFSLDSPVLCIHHTGQSHALGLSYFLLSQSLSQHT